MFLQLFSPLQRIRKSSVTILTYFSIATEWIAKNMTPFLNALNAKFIHTAL